MIRGYVILFRDTYAVVSFLARKFSGFDLHDYRTALPNVGGGGSTRMKIRWTEAVSASENQALRNAIMLNVAAF